MDLLAAGAADLSDGLHNWRIWHLMGTAELRRRYARSSVGQFWLTISTAITILALGLVWSVLWKLPVAEMLPYFSVGFVVWSYVSPFFVDANSAFISNGPYYINQKMSFSTAIYALAYRNIIILAHNAIIVVAVMIIFAVPISAGAFDALVGFGLVTVTGVSIAYVIAMLCTRYRDLTHVIASVIQVAFLVSPILWKEELMPPEWRWIVDWNPFAVLVSVIRDPILGIPVPDGRWLGALGVTGAAVLLALTMIGRYRHRIIYWL